jgi:hypothetical protein
MSMSCSRSEGMVGSCVGESSGVVGGFREALWELLQGGEWLVVWMERSR